MMMGTHSRAVHRLVILGALTGMLWGLNPAAADPSNTTESTLKACARPEKIEDPIADLRNDYIRSKEPLLGLVKSDCIKSVPAGRAFVVGADQGLSGKRYGVFYDRGAREEAEHLACSEYGHLKTPKGESKVNLHDLLVTHELWLAEAVAEEFQKAELTGKFQKVRDDEIHRLKSQPPVPAILISEIKGKKIAQIAPEHQPYACCVAGYLNGFTALHARASASDTPACSKTARCKEYYTKGKEVGEKVCAGRDCKDCQLEALKNDKDPLYGCMSAGYIDAVVSSKECKQKAATNEWYKGEVNNYTSFKKTIDTIDQRSLDEINPRATQAEPGATKAN